MFRSSLAFSTFAVATIIMAQLAVALAQSAPAYTVTSMGPVDIRNSYVGPTSGVFVVDQAKGQIVLCYPETKDNVDFVACTAPTKLP